VSPRCLPSTGVSGCDEAAPLPGGGATGAIGGPLGTGFNRFDTPIPNSNGSSVIPGHPDCNDLRARGAAAGLNSDANQGFISALCG